jgi:3-isopropylmalate/(R)-2-methylmalate dehydratase small subunit
MRAYKTVNGLVAPLDRANIDTDQIIPKQYLKSIKRTGFGDNLFDAWRFLDEGDMGMTPNERRLNHEFSLNQPKYQGAKILLTRENFGCGSSREHAVWSLMEYGFDVVIAPTFADIFHNNCFKNGLLPVALTHEVIDDLFARATSADGLMLTVDLEQQVVICADGQTYPFEIDADYKAKLLSGLDDITATLVHEDAIRSFEERHRLKQPWLFDR